MDVGSRLGVSRFRRRVWFPLLKSVLTVSAVDADDELEVVGSNQSALPAETSPLPEAVMSDVAFGG